MHASLRLLALAILLPSALARAGTIHLTTSDGVTLAADTWGTGSKGVVLVHGKGRTAEDWSWYGAKLAGDGYRVLALDLRGSGRSVPPDPPDDWSVAKGDVTAAVGWMKSHGAHEITLVGADLGGTLATMAGDDPAVTDLVLLSPGLNLSSLPLKPAVVAYGDRPLLLVASEADPYAVKSAQFLDSVAQGPHEVKITDTDSGAQLINRHRDLETFVTAWIGGGWKTSAEKTDASRDVRDVGEAGEIQTTGKRFGDH